MKNSFLVVLMLCVTKLTYAQQPFPLYFNTYYGSGAFASNVSGNYNAAFGNFALNKNTSGNYNTAVGAWALYNSNTSSNVAVGRRAGFSTTTGSGNTAIGTHAMQNNTTGLANVAVGNDAMANNVGGYFNTAVGNSAGPAFGSSNLYNATAIGYYAINTGNAQVRIGNEFVTDIGGHVSWSTLSDGRFKSDVREDVAGLEFINKLRPVSYILDEAGLSNALKIPDSIRTQLQAGRKSVSRQTGFVAQEVEAIVKKKNYSFNGVSAPQNENDHYSIRYAEFVVPLVKAVQELTSKLEAQEKEIKALRNLLRNSENARVDSMEDSRGRGASLQQNYPNPFSELSEISISLPEDVTHANLIFYTLEGKQLKVMPLSSRGEFNVNVHAADLNRGMYLYALIVDGKIVETRRLVVTGN